MSGRILAYIYIILLGVCNESEFIRLMQYGYHGISGGATANQGMGMHGSSSLSCDEIEGSHSHLIATPRNASPQHPTTTTPKHAHHHPILSDASHQSTPKKIPNSRVAVWGPENGPPTRSTPLHAVQQPPSPPFSPSRAEQTTNSINTQLSDPIPDKIPTSPADLFFPPHPRRYPFIPSCEFTSGTHRPRLRMRPFWAGSSASTCCKCRDIIHGWSWGLYWRVLR